MNMKVTAPRFAKPFSECLRPQTVDDLIQPASLRAVFARCIDRKMFPHMCFSGPPGLGKTSAIEILTRSIGADVLTVFGSNVTPQMRNSLDTFTSAVSLAGPKVCVIEEADFLPKPMQVTLRGFVEERDHCRFILTTNEIRRIDKALLSRVTPIFFSLMPTDWEEAIERLVVRYGTLLKGSGVDVAEPDLRAIIHRYFPDLRQIATQVELYLFP